MYIVDEVFIQKDQLLKSCYKFALFLNRMSVSVNVGSSTSVLLYGNNHWMLRQPDQVNKIDPWPGEPKSYLRQPVIASPIIQETKMEKPQTMRLNSCLWLFHLCLLDNCGGDHWLQSYSGPCTVQPLSVADTSGTHLDILRSGCVGQAFG